LKDQVISFPETSTVKEDLSYEQVMLRHAPNVLMGISFVEHGYQADVWERINDEEYQCHSECRDFGDNHKVPVLTEEFMTRFWDLVREFSKGK